jgi:hypothetical protein
MTGRKPTKVTGQRVIAAFSEYYLQETGNRFYPNYGMIVMAEKLSEFYTFPEVLNAMAYYFDKEGKKDFYNFLNTIDSIFRALDNNQQQHEWFTELERQTSETVKRIYQSKRGESN